MLHLGLANFNLQPINRVNSNWQTSTSTTFTEHTSFVPASLEVSKALITTLYYVFAVQGFKTALLAANPNQSANIAYLANLASQQGRILVPPFGNNRDSVKAILDQVEHDLRAIAPAGTFLSQTVLSFNCRDCQHSSHQVLDFKTCLQLNWDSKTYFNTMLKNFLQQVDKCSQCNSNNITFNTHLTPLSKILIFNINNTSSRPIHALQYIPAGKLFLGADGYSVLKVATDATKLKLILQ